MMWLIWFLCTSALFYLLTWGLVNRSIVVEVVYDLFYFQK
jgi:hypothetical protein